MSVHLDTGVGGVGELSYEDQQRRHLRSSATWKNAQGTQAAWPDSLTVHVI